MRPNYIIMEQKKQKQKKNLKKVLESDIANYAVNKTQKELFNWQNV